MVKGGDVIKNNVLKRIIAIMMLVFMMLPQLTINNVSYAANDTIDTILTDWLQKIDDVYPKFYHFLYKEENNIYNAYFMQIVLPEQKDEYPRIAYKYSSSGSVNFVLQTATGEYPIKLDLYVAESGRSVLKRQSANNFNVSGSDYGYLLEVAGNIESYEGQELIFSASVEEQNIKYSQEIQMLPSDWVVTGNFETIDQGKASETIWEIIWKVLTNVLEPVKNFIESLLNKVSISFADGILSAVCMAVGEPVTIDRVIFGKVSKLSINFWAGTEVSENSQTNIENPNSVMSVMAPVVSKWYSILFAIAVIVYMITLLVVGIKIVFSSTGSSKAKYKDVFQAWISGVIILCLFPYVMKYTVKLNNILVEMINEDLSVNNANPEPTPVIDSAALDNLSDSFGENDFIASIPGSKFESSSEDASRDTMLYVRDLASNLGKMSLTFVYFVMLGELIVILFVYYKRVFMMALLITIFPVVVMMYIIEKLTSGSSKAFGIWLKEYFILVFTQSFHAAVYVVVVNAGVQSYIEDENWLFMLMCIIFLFQGEKILRSIFGMQSTANTVSDLAKAGMAGYGMVKTATGILKRDKTEDKEERDLRESEEKVKPKPPETTGVSADDSGDATGGTGGLSGAGASTSGETTESELPQNITDDPNASFEVVQNFIRAEALKQRQKTKKGRGVAGKITTAMKITTGVAGATLGIAAGLAQGNVEKAFSNAVVGAAAGKKLGGFVTKPIRGISNAYRGRKLKQKILRGDYDQDFKELGLDFDALETETQEKFRNALASLATRTTRMGKTSGELKMLNTTKRINKKNK